MTRLQYRGVSYDNNLHQPPSAAPVDHIYRGQHYSAALLHEAAKVDSTRSFHYRGHEYHHQSHAEA